MPSDAEIDALIERLNVLCNPLSEMLPERERLTAFVRDGDEAARFLAALRDERDTVNTLNADLLIHAKSHAQEARTANSTIYEIYQVLSGGKGEPGNWNGAEPARRYVAAAEARVRELEQKLEQARAALEPFYNISMSYTDLSDDVYVFDNGKRLLSVADFRRARATLAEIGQRG